MAVIKLTFQPDTSKVKDAIKAIQSEFNSINGINIKIDPASAKNTKAIVANIKEATKVAKEQENERVRQARMANEQMVKDEQEAQKRRTQEWKNYFDTLNGIIKEDEKRHKESAKAKEKADKESAKAAEKAEKDKVKAAQQASADKLKLIQAARKEEDRVNREEQKQAEKLENARLRQAKDTNKQIVKDEQAAQRQRSQAAKEYYAEQERQAKANERAAGQVDTLRAGYASLLRNIEALKAQYPAGTFDGIEQQAREAYEEVNNLDRSSVTLSEDVKRLGNSLKGYKADIASARAETQKLDKNTESLWMNFQKFMRWYVLGNIGVKIVRSLRDALSTMREVDQELTNIQKVSDLTSKEIERIGTSAYETASKYGVAANEYLQAVYTFQKAGIGDSSEGMAELATKTMLVGDTTAEVATRFLISANAAWKFKGNLEELNRIVDEADKLNNSYAVTLEDIATGLPIVGATAAQVGMTAEQTMADISTIVASTGQSASKAATALRAIIMNLIGQTGELEDGTEVTTESINTLNEVLNKYAGESMAAAQASGKILDPMEAIAALAKAAEDPLVKETQLFEILAGLGGKLRTTQLTALVNNLDMYHSMLADTANAAGTADREISIMLDSWNAKTQILKNTWAEFIAKTIDSGLIKWVLDASTAVVKFADNLGLAVVAAAGFLTLFKSGEVVGAFKDFGNSLKSLKDLLTGVASGFTSVTTGIVSGIGVALVAISAAIMAYKSWDKARAESMRVGAEEAEQYTDSLKQYDEVVAKINDEKSSREDLNEIIKASSDQYDEEAVKLKSVNGLREDAIALIGEEAKAQAQAYVDANTAAYLKAKDVLQNEGVKLHSAQLGVQAYTEQYQRDGKLGLLDRIGLNNAQRAVDKYSERVENARNVVAAYEYALSVLNGTYDGIADTVEDVTDTTNDLNNAQNYASSAVRNVTEETKASLQHYSDLRSAIEAVSSAMSDNGEYSIELYNAMEQLNKVAPEVVDKLYDLETGELKVDTAQIEAKESLLDFVDAAYSVKLDGMISELERASTAALDLAGSIAMALPGGYNEQFLEAYKAENNPALQRLKQQKADWDAYVEGVRGRWSGGGGGGGGGSTTSTTDAELEKRKEAVALLKAELEFLKAKGASEAEIVAKQKEIQNALHNQAEYMREIEASQTDIYALSTEWWKIQNEITKDDEDELQQHKDRVSLLKSELSLLEAQGASNDEIVAKQRQIQDALKAQENYMRSIGASQTEINALVTEWYEIENKILKIQQELFETVKRTIDEYYDAAVDDKKKELEYEEKILAVQKAQIALQNAQNERNVRYFNAASGQWEWGANAKNVQSAKEALSKAQDALVDYQEQAAWAEFKAAWEYIAGKIKSGETTFDRAYKYMYNKMVEIQNKYNVDMGDVLEDSVGSFEGVNKTITDLDEQTAAQLGASVKSLSDANTNLGTAVGTLDTTLTDATANAKNAVDAFKSAFDTAKERVENGEWDIDTAFKYLRKKAKEISKTYGIDMTDALNKAISQMKTVYTGLKGISDAVKKGALTPKEAFDIISKALNSVSEKYGKSITSSVNDILKKKGGFEDGLDGLAKAVANGDMTFEDAWKLLEGAIDDTTELYGIDLQGELDTAIQNMGKSADALDDLWKTIVLNKMRMNSVSWLELDAQEKKAQEAGDTALVQKIQDQKAALHAENEALGATIGATYDKSGYWSLNGQKLYDPKADLESGEFSGGGGGAVAGSRATNKNQATIDAFGKHANSGQEQYFIPGMGVMNIGSATADLFNMKAGMKGNSITRYNVLFSGLFTPEEQAAYLSSGGIVTEEMAAKWNSQPTSYLYDFPLAMQDSSVQQMMANSGFNANGEYEGVAKVYGGAAGNTLVQIKNGKLVTSGLEGTGSNMLVTADGKILRFDKNGHVYATGETWESSRGSYDSTQKQVVALLVFDEQNKMLESGDYSFHDIYGRDGVYDEGGVLHGIGGIKATARDEMVLPPDITERLLTPINNGFVRGRMDDLRSMLGMQTEFGSVDNTRIGTQNNGDIYTMNGVTISEGQARVTTVYDLAQMARNLGAYKRS